MTSTPQLQDVPAPAPEPPADDRALSPTTDWPPWMALVALLGGLVLAAVAGLVVDLPAMAFGVKITSEHTPPGITIADTFVQDLAFVAAAVYCAQVGGRRVRAWQLGLRTPGQGWRRAGKLVLALLVGFIVLSAIWEAIFSPEKEKLLETLGSKEGTALLVLSAGLTCVVAPICEEILFRGFIFTALRNWRGTLTAAVIAALLFGGIHAGSAPEADLPPLAFLGFGLCLLYRYTGSLYPCMIAHSLNNSIAFSALEGWDWQAPVLIVAAIGAIVVLIRVGERTGLLGQRAPGARVDA